MPSSRGAFSLAGQAQIFLAIVLGLGIGVVVGTLGGIAHSGRVILAAFFTFALSGPLPPNEMGTILGVAVLLDAFLVRLLLPGASAWYLPGWLGRILPEISFGHGDGRQAHETAPKPATAHR